MPIFPTPDFLPALPEMFIGAMALALLVLGVFQGERSTREISWLAILVLAVVLALVLSPALAHGPERRTAVFGMFVIDGFSAYMKALVLIGSALSILLSLQYNESEGIGRFEYPVLILLSAVGMLAMISANDLLALYVGLELQSLALYVLASFARDSTRSTEAGLKYFVLGALASGMLLYGISMVYGYSGTINFDDLAKLFGDGAPPGCFSRSASSSSPSAWPSRSRRCLSTCGRLTSMK